MTLFVDYRKFFAATFGFLVLCLFASSTRAFSRDDFLVAPTEAKRSPTIVAPDDIFDESDPEMDETTGAPGHDRRAIDVDGQPNAPGAPASVSGARVDWTMSGRPTRAQQAMIASGAWRAAMVIARDGDELESYEALETATMFVQRFEAMFGRCAVAPRGGVVRLSCGASSAVLEPWAADQPTALRVAAFATPAWTFADGGMKAKRGNSAVAPSPIVYLRGLSAARLAIRP